MNVIDWSEAIARIRVWVIALDHLDPDGRWKTHPMLQARGVTPYGFAYEQISGLEQFLAAEHARITQAYMVNKTKQLEKKENK